MRTLALPKEVEHWSLTTLREKLVLLDLVKEVKIADVALPGEPHGMALSPDGKTLYRHFPDDLQVCRDHTPVPPSREQSFLRSQPMA